MGRKPKDFYAPIPARAIGDQRLKGLHHKVLSAIAVHDRRAGSTGKGQGCWAGNKRLAEMIGCDYTRLSTAITDLATWGYIERTPHPLNKKQRVLHVIYTGDDARFVGADSLPVGKPSKSEPTNNSLPTGKGGAEIVCLDFQEAQKDQRDKYVEYIPQKRGIEIIDSAEAAPPCGVGRAHALAENEEGEQPDRLPSDGNRLGQIQTLIRQVRDQAQLTQTEFRELNEAEDECFEIIGRTDDREHKGWAERLAVEVYAILEAAG